MPIGTYTPPPPGKPVHKNFFQFFIFFFFHFRCILLQISHKKCFFISISILGRSGVKSSMMRVHFPGSFPDCFVLSTEQDRKYHCLT